ncbi:winged helix-turn-helix domain-containing protein [Serratia sp. L9]|uniref:winged helix-turn-helix domain-containing protein n=1 Tax=Serratia sp. L9 TaxID=3423946 RepID=UPI003D66A98F
MEKVQYRIEGDILFCPNNVGFYHDGFYEELVSISSPAARLFSFLIERKGEVIDRDVLLQRVWEDYGLQASNNNLNQCLSTLRRIIKSMGIEKNIIETIPKVGLKIADDAVIEEINDTQNTTPTTEEPPKETKSRGIKINLLYTLITLVIILIVITSMHIFHIYSYISHRQFKNDLLELVKNNCEIPVSSPRMLLSEPFSAFKPGITF